jgi:hypothetical protein
LNIDCILVLFSVACAQTTMPAVTVELTSSYIEMTSGEFITDYVTTDVTDLDNSTMNGTIAFTEGIEMTTYSDLNFTGAESNETTMVMTTMDMLFTTVFDNTTDNSTIPDEPVPADCDTLCIVLATVLPLLGLAAIGGVVYCIFCDR